ncbi:MAG: aryl-sulfate sulfotransferase, partial [Porticoccaceae bacterium]
EYAIRFENVGSDSAGKSTEKGKAGSPDMRGFRDFGRAMTTKNLGPFGATPFNKGVKPGEDSRAFDGYIFYSTHDTNRGRTVGNTTWLLNSLFQPVHRWDSEHHAHEGVGPYLLENGLVVRPFSKGNWLYMENFYVASFTSLEIIDWDGNQLWEFDYCTPKRHCMHHDIEPMPNGNILLIVNDFKTHEEAESIGFKPTNDRAIAFQRIIEIEPNLKDGSTRIVWEWDILDHIVQDLYPDRPNYGKPSEHIGKIDVNYVGKSTKFIPGSVFHFNAISYNEERDQILVSNFGTNEIFILDHSTTTKEAKTDKGGISGKGGDLIYRWGNPNAYGMAGIESRQLFKQHDAAWIPKGIPGKGDISIFNNGVNRKPMYTAYIELELPKLRNSRYQRASNKPFGPMAPAYEFSEFAGDEPEVFFAPFMSGARRLPNGNIFGVSGIVSGMFEVTDEGEEVLRTVPGSRSTFYRAYKFPKDYPAFNSRNLAPLATGWSIPE